MDKKLYWDAARGKVTNNNKCAEIYFIKGCDCYTETYKIGAYRQISFAYTEEEKKRGL